MIFNELDHVLFFREREAAELAAAAIWEEHGDSETCRAALNAWRKAQIPGREAFLARIEDYALHGGTEQTLIRGDAKAIADSLEYATEASGEKRIAMFREGARNWAVHLEDYGAAAHEGGGGQAILELCTGAGMGTWAVLSRLPAHSTLHSTDFDFTCPPNAVGIAKALGLEGRAAGVCANNWCLPFYDSLFGTVCTHYGLDESREVPAVLREAARVLRPGGRLVLVARSNPWDRHGEAFTMYGAAEAEAPGILRKARLFSGPEDLIADAAAAGLKLAGRKDYRPENGHARVLFVFHSNRAANCGSVRNLQVS